MKKNYHTNSIIFRECILIAIIFGDNGEVILWEDGKIREEDQKIIRFIYVIFESSPKKCRLLLLANL